MVDGKPRTAEILCLPGFNFSSRGSTQSIRSACGALTPGFKRPPRCDNLPVRVAIRDHAGQTGALCKAPQIRRQPGQQTREPFGRRRPPPSGDSVDCQQPATICGSRPKLFFQNVWLTTAMDGSSCDPPGDQRTPQVFRFRQA